MEAFAFDEVGGTGATREIPVPEPEGGQVRIRVGAAGLDPFDGAVIKGYLKDAMEHRFPLVPGMDASGTVDAVGGGVDAFAVGDEVFGSVGKGYLGEGTLAEFVTMSTQTVARKPDDILHEVAAAIPVAGVTALTMADALALEKGHVVVAIGATGGVGSYFVQLATARGAHVVAVCSGENAAYARTIGAADVVDYTSGDVVDAVRSRFPDGVDAIADMHGDKEMVARLAEQVREGGHVASVVGVADPGEFSTPLRFIADNWGLPYLTPRIAKAHNMEHLFDFRSAPPSPSPATRRAETFGDPYTYPANFPDWPQGTVAVTNPFG